MGAGKNRQTFFQKENSPLKSTEKFARNLSKNQLGGVIFGCTNSTKEECQAKQLFGQSFLQCSRFTRNHLVCALHGSHFYKSLYNHLFVEYLDTVTLL